jgi:hypothetical protein
VSVLIASLEVWSRDTMIAEYDVSTKTESIRRHKKTILEETFSGGFDKPEMKIRILQVMTYHAAFIPTENEM